MTNNATNMGSDVNTTHPMEAWLAEEFALDVPSAGEIREGTIVDRRHNEFLVDIGAKSEGIIPSQEVEALDAATIESNLVVGNKISVYVVNPEDHDGNIILSYQRAAEEIDWDAAKKALETQNTQEVEVVGFNKGGFIVQFGSLRGFVPMSQQSGDTPRYNDPRDLQRACQKRVGSIMMAKIIEVDRPRNRLIFSERAADEEIREAKRNKFFDNVQEGDIFDGTIVNVTDYGAFVDIGGIEGLVHLSEISWQRITKPSEKVQAGDEVKVAVLSVDQDKQRIALSMKQLEADPWTRINDTYQIGQLVDVTVTKLTKFGAFARLHDEYELEGLIHISELSDNHISHAREVVKPQDQLTVRIIRIDADQRQLGLSLKQVASAEYMNMDLVMAGIHADENDEEY
ncbi:MAG: S1 RNA-binding domain-containing protein [Ardenticatenaceae bacterium]|nr:S1 RNA-binding domain-containing protein [Ardenticatenaceae bacterium]